MSLQYNILWVDDRKEEFQSIEMDKDIESYVRELFFAPSIDFYDNISDAEKSTENKKYDIVFSDYNITEDGAGLVFLENLRKRHVDTEVLFYSAQQDLPATNLDRIVFFHLKSMSAYDELKNKMKSVVDLTIEKLNDLSNLRGLVMSEVSELDYMMKQIVSKHCDNVDDEKKLRDYIVGKIETRSKDALESQDCKKQCAHVWRNKSIKDVVFEQNFESYTTAMALYHIFKEKKITKDFSLNTYWSEIISNRNMLAHCKAIQKSDGKEVLKTLDGEQEFSASDINVIRKNILKYHVMFESFLENPI